jgi:DNA (cytosine-5)-methyltransferase 1
MTAYYNENNAYAASRLRYLIANNLIAPGDVDERSILEVTSSDLVGYQQCHFFAGIGGWSLAFRYAGVPDSEPVWSGSCPCQPFSAAGLQAGFADKRHLWPAWHGIIRKCRPAIIFGEQVTNAIRLEWLDQVFGNLEEDQYACGAAVLPANTVGADHERKRIYWVAYALRKRHAGLGPIWTLQSEHGPPHPFANDPFVGARNAVGGDFISLLPGNGLSLAMERQAIRAYGNAIVPQAAAAFIRATLTK